MAAVVELQVSVAVPEPVTVAGVTDPQVRPTGTVSVMVTVPLKPLTAVTVIVAVADWLTSTAAGELTDIVKSVIVNIAVVE